MNEVFLFLSVIIYFGLLLFMYKFFGKMGLYIWTAIITMLANVEVLVLVEAFGSEMTLGNVAFASTFLATDILSERHGKDAANLSVKVGFVSLVSFTLITQSWLWFTPAVNDEMFGSVYSVFANTPRLAISSIVVYLISQKIDIILYHKWWDFSNKRTSDNKNMLWLRNNGSTMISQLVNSVLFTLFAFYGVFDMDTLVSIATSSYIIFLVLSLIDTPFIYFARKMKINEIL